MRCDRTDGSSTWERRQGEFFVLHDLGHYAVETVLGLAGGFYGLVSSGWDISDFGSPWPRGPIPEEAAEEAMLAEWAVSLLDRERAQGDRLDGAAFSQALSSMAEGSGHPEPRSLSDQQLAAIRDRFQRTALEWRSLSAGEALSLVFPLTSEP